MIFKPEGELVFTYEPRQHLQTTLTIQNTSKTLIPFKIKVSNRSKFSIQPREGELPPSSDVVVLVTIHREIVDTVTSQKFYVQYGPNYQVVHEFKIVVMGGSVNDQLNLTVMVDEKNSRIRELQSQVTEYRSMAQRTPEKKKSNRDWKTVFVVFVMGLIIGYLVPIRLFKRGW